MTYKVEKTRPIYPEYVPLSPNTRGALLEVGEHMEKEGEGVLPTAQHVIDVLIREYWDKEAKYKQGNDGSGE